MTLIKAFRRFPRYSQLQTIRYGSVPACKQRHLHHQGNEAHGFTVESCFGQSCCPNRIDTGENLHKRLEPLLRSHSLKEFMQGRVSGPLTLHHEFRVTLPPYAPRSA